MEPSTLTMARRAERAASWPERARGGVRWLAGAVLVICLHAALGWVLHLDVLVQWGHDAASMKVTSLVAFSLLALACVVDRPRFRVAAASTVLLCAPAMSNESITRLTPGSASSRST